MSQADSPRGILNSPRSTSEQDKDRTLSRDISLAVAAIIEESKTYKDVDYLDSARKNADSPRGFLELLPKHSLDSSITGTSSSKPGSDKLKKFKKKLMKKVKIAVPKMTSITSKDNKAQSVASHPPAVPLKSAPTLLLDDGSKKLDSYNILKSASTEMKTIKAPKSIKVPDLTTKRAKTTPTDARTHAKNKKKLPNAAARASEVADTEHGDRNGSLSDDQEQNAASKIQEHEGEPQSTQKREKRFLPSPPNYKDYGPMEIVQYISSVQKYIDQLGYERDGEPKIRVNTKLSMKHLMGTAKQLIKAGEHIKCLHALIMGIHFTNNSNIVERFPIHFRSLVNGKTYKHVILGIYVVGNYGALGISRDAGLQDKPPIYPRLSDMINDYFRHYTDAGHELKEVQIGNIISHNALSLEPITWKLAKIDMQTLKLTYETEIEKCSRRLRSQMGTACLKCNHMDPYEYIEQTATSKVLRTSQTAQQKSKSLSIAAMKSRSFVASKASAINAIMRGKRTLPATAPAQKQTKIPVKPVAVKPIAVKPVTVKPVTVKPVTIKPVTVKPITRT